MNGKTAGGLALTALVCMLDGKSGSRIIWSLVREYQRKRARTKKLMGYEAMRVVLSRLQKDGLVEKGGLRIWKVTKKGRRAVEAMNTVMIPQPTAVTRAERNTIVMFDVPERDEKKRRYLRLELKELGFEMLQKSVWIGGGPLPKEFIEYLRRMRLLRHVHIFSINKRGTISGAIAE
ncbi:MAG: CRISPR-associated endonuclease Cas2 [bacterium]|nr:CRISPR-associated endonuclease Cas2 [bacterium]